MGAVAFAVLVWITRPSTPSKSVNPALHNPAGTPKKRLVPDCSGPVCKTRSDWNFGQLLKLGFFSTGWHTLPPHDRQKVWVACGSGPTPVPRICPVGRAEGILGTCPRVNSLRLTIRPVLSIGVNYCGGRKYASISVPPLELWVGEIVKNAMGELEARDVNHSSECPKRRPTDGVSQVKTDAPCAERTG